jgi:small subunit ribosomal protein S16
MLKIRMQRTGRINQPSYRIIVTEHARAAKTGSFLEELGTYDPATKARTLKDERVKYWISVGAQPSPTMHNMLVSAGVIKAKKVNVLPKKTVPKKEGEAEAAQAPVAAEEKPAAETPAEVQA